MGLRMAIVVVLAALSATTRAVSAPARTEPATDDFALERRLLSEAKSSFEANDLATSRSLANEAFQSLVSRPDADRDGSWLDLLERAAYAARATKDLHVARQAFELLLETGLRRGSGDHPAAQRTRRDLAGVLTELGRFREARALQETTLETASRSLPDDHPELQSDRLSLAVSLKALGELPRARALEEKVVAVLSASLPEAHEDLLGARTNLAVTVATMGDEKGSLLLFEKLLEIQSRTLPDEHPRLQSARKNLAVTLLILGDFQGAKSLFEKVLDVHSRTLPENHRDVQSARQGLAMVALRMGDLPQARSLFEQAVETISRTSPDDHPDLQVARQGLASVLIKLGDRQGARLLYEKVLEVRSRTLPEDHRELLGARSNIASLLLETGEARAALSVFEEILDAASRSHPEDRSLSLSARHGVALARLHLGHIPEARGELERVYELLSRTVRDDHFHVQSVRWQLAFVLARHFALPSGPDSAVGPSIAARPAEDRDEYARLATAFVDGLTAKANEALLAGSVREAEELCAFLESEVSTALSLAEGLGIFPPDESLQRKAFLASEKTRCAALSAARLRRGTDSSGREDELRRRARSASEDLARAAQSGATKEEYEAARRAREAAESELLALMRDSASTSGVSLDSELADFSRALSATDALVAFRCYRRSSVRGEIAPGAPDAATRSLCAFVVRSGERLRRVELGPIEFVESAVSEWRSAIEAGSDRGAALEGESTDRAHSRGDELRRLVFDPLLPALADCRRIVVALDDVLHLVPLDALPTSEPRTTLGDRYRIETRATLAELTWKPEPLGTGRVLLAVGGASFNSKPTPWAGAEASEAGDSIAKAAPPATSPSTILRGGEWERGFTPLTYTGLEAREVATLFEETFEGRDAHAIVLEKRRASREALSEIAPRARFLHVATHGWFAPESIASWDDQEPLDAASGIGMRMSPEERVRGMNPMLLCGLALAGANLPSTAGRPAPGLVTAEEISSLSLGNCELAILSACDTHVGDSRAGQGVASLQKALHMAGARSVVTSLWKVPDEATRELMVDFYRRLWVEKKEKAVALWEAKVRLRDAKDEGGRPKYTTRDWAAWVLTGEPGTSADAPTNKR